MSRSEFSRAKSNADVSPGDGGVGFSGVGG